MVILCLGFLLMVGLVLVVDGFGYHFPKGYFYAAIGFSVLIETFNQLAQRNRTKAVGAIPAPSAVAGRRCSRVKSTPRSEIQCRLSAARRALFANPIRHEGSLVRMKWSTCARCRSRNRSGMKRTIA